jgi:hypothetical protein
VNLTLIGSFALKNGPLMFSRVFGWKPFSKLVVSSSGNCLSWLTFCGLISYWGAAGTGDGDLRCFTTGE